MLKIAARTEHHALTINSGDDLPGNNYLPVPIPLPLTATAQVGRKFGEQTIKEADPLSALRARARPLRRASDANTCASSDFGVPRFVSTHTETLDFAWPQEVVATMPIQFNQCPARHLTRQ